MKLYDIQPSKTYATRENAIKAIEKKFPNSAARYETDFSYTILLHTDGRYFPVAFGQKALDAGVHFHFNVISL